jgi:hypothetical protein
MKKLLLLIIVLALGAGGYWYWTQHNAAAPAQAAANQDARALTAAEQTAFLPLVCGGLSAGSDGYAHDCTSLPGYPSSDYGGAGTGLGITLTSVITGHLSNATDDQAYVSYQGSFESHADNFGGGILLRADGKGGWSLQKWVQGGVMDGCLSLNPQGRAQMLCLSGSTGQGETATVLMVVSIPNTSGTNLLSASDLRQTMDPNANCGLRTSASQDVLLGIDAIARSGAGYAVQIEYVPAATAEDACKSKNFANAPVSKTTLTLDWDGSAAQITPGFNFAPSS